MPPVRVNPDRIREFANAASFYKWLATHHNTDDELWIKIHKVHSGLKSITPSEAIDVVLCWGWIDGIRKSFDERSYLQRYTPRTKSSIWSQINVDNVARLVKEGRMTEYGLREVDKAKSDGRWARAYEGAKQMTIPADLASCHRCGTPGQGDVPDPERSKPLRARLPAFIISRRKQGAKRRSHHSSRCSLAERRFIRRTPVPPAVRPIEHRKRTASRYRSNCRRARRAGGSRTSPASNISSM